MRSDERRWIPPELEAEMQYRINERLGILCEGEKPSPEQEKLAREEAMQWLAMIKQEYEGKKS